MIKAIIFDLDNTLVDFMRMKNRAIDAAINAMIDAGLPLTKEESLLEINTIYKEQGIEYQQVFDQFLTRTIKRIDHKLLASGIIAYRKIREAELIPYPRVYPTLIELIKLGLKLGVLSDAPSKEAWLRLAQLNFQYLFDSIVTFEDTGYRKPNPEPFYEILKRLNVTANESLMVGDWAERDIIGASQIGMLTAFAKYGDTFNTEIHNANFVLNDITDLLGIVKSINKL
ncbi:MAG: TIGR02253 family HAD-type hydrolase [Bacteroidota bacterium]